MRWMRMLIGAVSILLIFIGITFVPASSMSNDTTMENWMQDHTVKVNSTTTYKYEQGYLRIDETYTGEELEELFGIEQFTKVLKMPVDDKLLVEGRVLGMQEGEERIFVAEKITVLTSGDDPPPWWDNYSYPQWIWLESGGIYERNLPINLAWKNTTLNTVKSEILKEGWVNVSYPFELTEYVYDPLYGWIADNGVADSMTGLLGRYHALLWWLSNENVVANAHHDDPFPHKADELEEAEELVAGFFNESEDTEWNVYEDSYNLDNNVTSPYSDGWCTEISYGSATWYVPDGYLKIQWAVDNATAGDTIIVKNGTYYENVVVDKPITLQGEARDSTIIDGGGVGDVVKVVGDGCKISGFMVRNSGGIWDSTDAGIELASSNNNITDNNITNNHYNGILLNSSSNNTIRNNVVSNTYNDEFPDGIGINLHCSTGNSIIDNNVNSNDRCGIFLFNLSNNNTIKNNTVSNNAWGIDLRYRSSHNYLSNNTIFNNSYRNFNVEGYNIEDFNNTIDINNTVNGKPVHYYFNKQNKTIENLDSGHLQLTYCSNITLKNSTVKDGDGIELDFTENSELVNNIVSNNPYGITLDHSSDNMIIDNKAFNNGYGIYLVSDSNTNKIINNIVNLNGGNGILLSYSSNYNKIGNNTINGSSFGFQIHHSSNNQIIDNIISNNRHGIYLFWCSDKNTIANNTISNNTISGIGFFSDCINNTVYHNNFIHNIVQAEDYGYNNSWDSGPIEGGNYWSDHDCEGNPNNGSQPYYIDPNGKDSYPFQNENGWLISVVFDTGQPENPYPSIFGTHNGTIKPNQTITVSTLYTYPCPGTGGHTEYARIYNESGTVAEATWNGYKEDWHNISFNLNSVKS